LQRNRNVIYSETSGSNGSSSPLSPLSSSPSSVALKTVLENLESPSEMMEGVAFNVLQVLSLQGGIGYSGFHIDEVYMPSRVGFIDGTILHYSSQEPDVRQSIETEVLGLQADLDVVDVPTSV